MALRHVILATTSLVTSVLVTEALVTSKSTPPTPEVTYEQKVTPKSTVLGTSGDSLPVLYDQWWLRATDDVAIVPALNESSEFRTNVMWIWEGRIKFEIQVLAYSGQYLGSLIYDTGDMEQPVGMHQVNRLLKEVDKTYEGGYNLHVFPIEGDGKVFFYATMIDNKSQDFVCFTQFRYSKTEGIWMATGWYGNYSGGIAPMRNSVPTPTPRPTRTPITPEN